MVARYLTSVLFVGFSFFGLEALSKGHPSMVHKKNHRVHRTLSTSTLVIVESALLVGCASTPDFDKYVGEFQKEARRHGIEYRMPQFEFGKPLPTELSSHNLAECRPRSALNRAVIIVDQDQWSLLSEVSKEALVFHEMGHCVLHKGHGKGIMEATLIDEKRYLSHKRTLLKKLFKKVRKSQ